MKILEGFKDRPFSYAKKNNPIITKLFSSQGKKQTYNQHIKKEALKAYQWDQKYREHLVQVLVE